MRDDNISFERQRAEILQQMGHIPHLIRGKLTVQTYGVQGHSQGPYFTLQRWENGKNKSQRIAAPQLPLIQDAVRGYERFQQLASQYVQLTEEQTWAAQTDDLKKKFHQFSGHPFPAPSLSSKKRAGK